MSYTEIINAVTIGNHTNLANNNLTIDQANELLLNATEMLKLKEINNRCYDNDKYFVYIAKFPYLHLAIDNKAGTSRLYSITNKSELLNIK